MFNSLKKKFVIEEDFCIATEVVEHDRKTNPSNRTYPTFTLDHEELVKFEGKHYRHKRFIDLVSSDELKKLGITERDIIRSCQGPIKLLKKRRD